MRFKAISLILTMAYLTSACAVATIRPNGGAGKLSSTPTFEESHGYFIGGIVGEAQIDASKVCGDPKSVEQIQTLFTFVDGLFGWVTFSLYSPKSVKIWCKR
jgi:hypothetical protein